ncbi:MAG: hypothetical protein NVSMB12_21740 [Acidimicrobiales bacterium]
MAATLTLAPVAPESAVQRRRVEVVGMTIVVLNVVDVLVTRLILRTHPASHEGNGLMARIILSRWVWLPKAGIPLTVLFSSARSRVTRVSWVGMFAVAGIYWSVIAWNVHILFL